MKKTLLSIALALTLLPIPTIPAKAETYENVIVELNPHADMPAYEYALNSAKYAASEVRGLTYDSIYDTLLCGYSAKLPASAVAELEKLDNVKNVYYCASYEPMSYSYTDADTAMLAAEMAGIGAVKGTGLTGDGVKVAVIDSSFDVSHPAFDAEVTETVDLESFKNRLALNKLNAQRELEDIMTLRHNSKIPFRFDYVDKDTDVLTESDHGTHVAGIIGAVPNEKSSMSGIAPDCQLLLMKVFSDDGSSALDSVLISALEDALKLGANVINMSIGHYAGSSHTSRIIGLDNLIKRIEESGCIVVCAAGNDSVTTDRSVLARDEGIRYPLASYTDYGTVSSPSASDYAFSVAAVNNAVFYGDYIRHGNNGDFYFEFTDTNVAGEVIPISFKDYFNGKTMEYAVIPGVGEESDYEGIDVTGKLVLVERGIIPFADKANIAAGKGAAGVIVYNNNPSEYVNMELAGAAVPAIFITREDGMRLISESIHTVTITADLISKPHPASAGKISEYSSMGTTPTLDLKPDIAGVGGSVYSTIVGGGYGGISGTSMASPQIAGICALLVEKEMNAHRLITSDTVKEIKTTLSNTAIPVYQDNGTEYSPRAQGAGLVNLEAALRHTLRLTGSETDIAKVQLYDKLSDTAEFKVKVRNTGTQRVTFKLSVTLSGDGYSKIGINGKDEYFNTLQAVPDGVSCITSENSGNLNRNSDDFAPREIALESGEEITLPIKIAFDENYYKERAKIFTNGSFVEGFVYLDTDGFDVSMPYMGYLGDFSAAPVIDGDVYKGEAVMFKGSRLYIPLDNIHISAGYNIYKEPRTYDASAVSFSPNGDGNADEILFGTSYLRNFLNARMTLTDEDGNIITTSFQSYGTKTKGIDETTQFRFFWDGGDDIYTNYKMPDGKYTMTIEYTLDDGRDTKQTYSYGITLDTVYPTADSISVKDGTLKISASDQNGIFGIRIYENTTEDAFSAISTDSITEFDISEFSGTKLYYDIVDYAYNTTVGVIDLTAPAN